MTKLEVEEFEDIKSGYKIRFHFEENPYFDNTVLEKEFHTGPSGESYRKSTEIKWKPESELARKMQSPANGKGKRRYSDENPRTFFMWFTEQGDSSTDDIADMIKDDMWPNPLQYFLVSDMEAGENGANIDEADEDELESLDEEYEEGDEEEEEEEAEEENEGEDNSVVVIGDEEDIDEGEYPHEGEGGVVGDSADYDESSL